MSIFVAKSIEMRCESGCYMAKVAQCEDIVIKASLPPSTAVFALISKTHFSNVHSRQLNTTALGDLVLAVDDFPAGYFSCGSGTFKVELKNTIEPIDTLPMIFNGKIYYCLMFEVFQFDAGLTSPLNVIQ